MIDDVSAVRAVAIDWYVGSLNVLTLLVANDGTINRMGNGSPALPDRDLYVGRTPTTLLPRLTRLLSAEMLAHTGSYDLTPIVGTPCKLAILLWADNQKDGFEFKYGSESGGLPQEIPAFVNNAIHATQPWYEAQQRQVVNAEAPSKPWWKLW